MLEPTIKRPVFLKPSDWNDINEVFMSKVAKAKSPQNLKKPAVPLTYAMAAQKDQEKPYIKDIDEIHNQ